MTAVRVLAEGRTKFTILTTKPANPASPTAAELNAGLDASCKVTREGFAWSPSDSDTIDDAELCSTSKAVAPGAANADLGFQVYRYYLDAGGVDPAGDTLFAAVKTKGTVLWGYVRQTDKLASAAWAANDEIALGAEFWVDHPQLNIAGSGWTKAKVPCHANNVYPWIKAAAGA